MHSSAPAPLDICGIILSDIGIDACIHTCVHEHPRLLLEAGLQLAPLWQVLPMVHEDIAAVRDNNNAARWMLATYHNMDPRGPIVSVARGEGDLGELKKSLETDKAMYGLYHVTDKVDDIVTVKFVYITW